MVITSLLSKVIPLAAVGLGIAFLANVLTKPGQASASAGALGQTFGAFGSGLGSLGEGVSGLLTGIGQGSAKLLDPLFSLKTLFYGDDSVDVILSENQATASNTTRTDPVVNTASDQPGVTPTSPASSTVTHTGPGFTQTTTSTGPATVTSAGITSRAAGRATRFG
jgi:hypothetical protein